MSGSGENSDLGCPWESTEDEQGRKPAKLKGAAEKAVSQSETAAQGSRDQGTSAMRKKTATNLRSGGRSPA